MRCIRRHLRPIERQWSRQHSGALIWSVSRQVPRPPILTALLVADIPTVCQMLSISRAILRRLRRGGTFSSGNPALPPIGGDPDRRDRRFDRASQGRTPAVAAASSPPQHPCSKGKNDAEPMRAGSGHESVPIDRDVHFRPDLQPRSGDGPWSARGPAPRARTAVPRRAQCRPDPPRDGTNFGQRVARVFAFAQHLRGDPLICHSGVQLSPERSTSSASSNAPGWSSTSVSGPQPSAGRQARLRLSPGLQPSEIIVLDELRHAGA